MRIIPKGLQRSVKNDRLKYLYLYDLLKKKKDWKKSIYYFFKFFIFYYKVTSSDKKIIKNLHFS